MVLPLAELNLVAVGFFTAPVAPEEEVVPAPPDRNKELEVTVRG